MDLKEKLKHLREQENLALYKWTAGSGRIGDNLIRLSDLRLNLLTCDSGSIVLSIAAPVTVFERGRQQVRLYDEGVLCVDSGNRRGLNVLPRMLRGLGCEDTVPATLCLHRVVSGAQPNWVVRRVLSLGCTPCIPVNGLVQPDIYRLTREPEKLRLVLGATLLRSLGVPKEATLEEITKAFVSIPYYGVWTQYGYLVPACHVASGGMGVVLSRGITARSGSAVHCAPLDKVRAELERLKWEVHTSELE